MKFKKTISIVLTALMIPTQFNAGAMFNGGFAAFVGSPQARTGARVPSSQQSTGGSDEFTPNPTTDPLRVNKKLVVHPNPSALSTAAHPQVPETIQRPTSGTRAQTSMSTGSASRPAGRQPTNAKTVRQYAAPMSSEESSLPTRTGGDDSDSDVPVFRPVPEHPSTSSSILGQQTYPSFPTPKLQPAPQFIPVFTGPNGVLTGYINTADLFPRVNRQSTFVPIIPTVQKPTLSLAPSPGVIKLDDFSHIDLPPMHDVKFLANRFNDLMVEFIINHLNREPTDQEYFDLRNKIADIVQQIKGHTKNALRYPGISNISNISDIYSGAADRDYVSAQCSNLGKLVLNNRALTADSPEMKEFNAKFIILANFFNLAFLFAHPQGITVEMLLDDVMDSTRLSDFQDVLSSNTGLFYLFSINLTRFHCSAHCKDYNFFHSKSTFDELFKSVYFNINHLFENIEDLEIFKNSIKTLKNIYRFAKLEELFPERYGLSCYYDAAKTQANINKHLGLF